MATGRSNKLVGQVGEFLVCAELGRRGLIATPFAGNVPAFDLIATDGELNSVPIQVKTSNGSSWQFSGGKLLDIAFEKATGRQQVLGIRDQDNHDLIYVFVWLGHSRSRPDRFFILTKGAFLTTLQDHYEAYLEKHGGRRPKSPESMYSALRLPDLEPFEDNWKLIERTLAGGQS